MILGRQTFNSVWLLLSADFDYRSLILCPMLYDIVYISLPLPISVCLVVEEMLKYYWFLITTSVFVPIVFVRMAFVSSVIGPLVFVRRGGGISKMFLTCR